MTDPDVAAVRAALLRAIDAPAPQRSRRRVRRIAVVALVAVAAGGPAVAALTSGPPAVERLGALEQGVETVTLADGTVRRGPAPELYGMRSGTDPDVWSAYPPTAVRVEIEAVLPDEPHYGGGGRLHVRRTRDRATGATTLRRAQEVRDRGVIRHVDERCPGRDRPCTTRTWETPAPGDDPTTG